MQGFFPTSVNISNNVSSLVLTADVDVQKLIDVAIVVERYENGVRSKGFEEMKNYFRSDEVVLFNVTSQPKDLSYAWDFGDSSPLSITTEPYTSHIYNHSGAYKVTVTVDNTLAKLSTIKDINIQKAVGAVSINTSYPTYYGDPTYFTIDIEEPVPDICLVLDFQDSFSAYLGDVRCKPSLLSPKYKYYKLRANQTRANLEHVYGTRGTYMPTLNASNLVSVKVVVALVNITSSPCDVPTVKIAGDGSEDPPSKIQMSERLLLKSQVKYRCPVAASLVFTWGAFEVTHGNPHDESKPLELPVDAVREIKLPATSLDLERADLPIKERQLPFGLIKFKLKLGFIGKDRDLSDKFGTHTVWIEVERSELFAVIRGEM